MTREEISAFHTGDGFYELKFSEAEMSDAFNGGFLDAINHMLDIIDDADKKAGYKTYIVLDNGVFYSQARYIKEKILELLEDKNDAK